jgi:hypothetical protein
VGGKGNASRWYENPCNLGSGQGRPRGFPNGNTSGSYRLAYNSQEYTISNLASIPATPNWTVSNQREAPIQLPNGDWVDGVVITILVGPDQVPLTTGIRNALYTADFVKERAQKMYDIWASVQGLSG